MTATATQEAHEWQPCEVIYFNDCGMLIEFERSDRTASNNLYFRAYVPFYMFDEGQVPDFHARLYSCTNECHDATHAEDWPRLAEDLIAAL